jgi:hypothetical protein
LHAKGEASNPNAPKKEVGQNLNFIKQMKKYLFSAFVFLFTVSACNQSNEVTPTDNFSKEIAQLKTMHKEGLYLASSAFKKNLTINSTNDLALNEKGMVSDVLNGLNGTHFTASGDFVASLSSNFGTKNLSGSSNANLSQFYDESQLQLVQPFLDELLTTDDFVKARNLASNFQSKVIASKLVRDEKIKLLSLSASVQALSEFIEEGGDDSIRQTLSQLKDTNGIPNARVAGCSVNWGDVWMGAVVGGAVGAVGGCYAGATAGTVTFPGVGTVTGCVSAGVIGGAGGFASGAAQGIVSGLLRTCFK